MQIIDHHHRAEAAAPERPGAAVLKVPSKAARQPRDISVNGEDGVATSREEPHMAAPTGGEIEHGGGGRHEIGEACDPRRDWRPILHSTIWGT